MFKGIYTSFSHFFFLLIVCCIVFFSFIVKFLSSKIGAIFFIALSMMFLLLLINPMSSAYCCIYISAYSQLRCLCPVLCSNSGHEDVQWVLEKYYVHYNNYGHIDELVFLLIMYLKGTV